ncbi:hypothetical protein G9C85_01685 [Halorubellus sp. JP-L1]|uniref:DUF5805 domain-containing protein n=1 Tax=Halorubellus sp. JP-L1 TaxID=2715753 RepID=UPI001407ABC4|nr:DUF5805 domain-containing protein [Halorubellus sp. JP-L1]NHN40348.1 hypothetical protein [Halorubellus sp. JP-L1]
MSEPDVDRTVVKTYVPRYQKDEWVAHAQALGMSQSEYVRTMVQAGRRDFAVDPFPERDGDQGTGEGRSTPDDGDGSDAGDGSEFEDRVFELLREETRSWDELLEAVTDDVETRLEDALQALQADNRVVYSGRNGGYQAVASDRTGGSGAIEE